MSAGTIVVAGLWLHVTTTTAEPANHHDGAGHRSRLPVGVPMAVAQPEETEEVKVGELPQRTLDVARSSVASRPTCTGMLDHLLALLAASGAGPSR